MTKIKEQILPIIIFWDHMQGNMQTVLDIYSHFSLPIEVIDQTR